MFIRMYVRSRMYSIAVTGAMLTSQWQDQCDFIALAREDLLSLAVVRLVFRCWAVVRLLLLLLLGCSGGCPLDFGGGPLFVLSMCCVLFGGCPLDFGGGQLFVLSMCIVLIGGCSL